MSDLNDSLDPQQPSKSVAPEKVGDLLHKERVTRRITVETIAKDLKLNVKYIKSIEANSFADLPADPYVRVYLRSIASYLMLDPEEILKKFFEDRGLPTEEVEHDKSEKISIDVKRDADHKSRSWIIIASIFATFALLSFISNKMGWISNSVDRQPAPLIDSTQTNHSDDFDSTDMDYDSSLIPDQDTLLEDSSQTQNLMPAQPYSANKESDSLKLVIHAIKDSVWIQVFADGISWKNFIKANYPRVFTANDSFNLHVGNNSRLRYFLNGKKITPPGNGVKVFKIQHDIIESWTFKKWNTVFENRL